MWRKIVAKNVPCGEKITIMMYASSYSVSQNTEFYFLGSNGSLGESLMKLCRHDWPKPCSEWIPPPKVEMLPMQCYSCDNGECWLILAQPLLVPSNVTDEKNDDADARPWKPEISGTRWQLQCGEQRFSLFLQRGGSLTFNTVVFRPK